MLFFLGIILIKEIYGASIHTMERTHTKPHEILYDQSYGIIYESVKVAEMPKM